MVRATHMLSHCYSASLFCSARVVRVAASAVIYKGKEYGCTVSMLHPNTTYKYVGLSCRCKPCTYNRAYYVSQIQVVCRFKWP